MYVRKPDHGCKLITIDTGPLSTMLFNSYAETSDFIQTLAAYALSQAVLQKKFQDFENEFFMRPQSVLMKDQAANAKLATFLHEPNHQMTFATLFGRQVGNMYYIDFMESALPILDSFFTELVTRISGKHSRYEDKTVLVSVDVVAPSLLSVSYMTVKKLG